MATRLGRYNFVTDSLSILRLIKIFVNLVLQCRGGQTEGDYLETKSNHVIYTSSGRSALYLLLKSIYESTEHFEATPNIIIPGFSCVVVCNAAVAAGFEVRFADIQKSDFCLDHSSVSKLVDDNTVALIVHHLFGFVDEKITEFKLKWPQLLIIEDCAHSLGSVFSDGSAIGSRGDFSFFSFEQSKPVTAWDGGALVINNKGNAYELILKNKSIMQKETTLSSILSIFFITFYTLCYARPLYRVGIPIALLTKKMFMQKNSMTSKELAGQFDISKYWLMSPLKVNLINIQLSDLGLRKKIRSKRAAIMSKKLNQFQNMPTNSFVLRFPLLVNDKREILQRCKANNFLPGLWFSSPLHPVPIGDSRFPYACGSCPNAEFISSRILNLPVSEKYSDQDIMQVVNLMTAFIE